MSVPHFHLSPPTSTRPELGFMPPATCPTRCRRIHRQPAPYVVAPSRPVTWMPGGPYPPPRSLSPPIPPPHPICIVGGVIFARGSLATSSELLSSPAFVSPPICLFLSHPLSLSYLGLYFLPSLALSKNGCLLVF